MNNQFEQYLYDNGYRISTVHHYRQIMAIIENWAIKMSLPLDAMTYRDLLRFMDHCIADGQAKRTINGKLNVLRHYYKHLIKTGIRKDNPALPLRMKNIIKTQPYHLLKYEDLENLFARYHHTGATGRRNKAMLGLLLFQGIKTGELMKIEMGDLDLEKATIHISAQARSNGRILRLEGIQLIGLQNYIQHIRPVLLQMSGKSSDKLFISAGSGPGLHNTLSLMLKQLKILDSKITGYGQIRASLISHWLQTHHLREVQYRAGHKYVSSTEHYQSHQIASLLEDLERLESAEE